MITSLLFDPASGSLKEGGEELIAEWQGSAETVLWINYDGEDPAAELAQMTETFGIHKLAVQDAQRDRHPPKIEAFEDHTFILLKGLDADTNSIDFGTIQIAVFVGERFCVTRHSGRSVSIEKLRAEIAADPDGMRRGASYVAMRLGRLIVDRYLPILLDLESRLDQIEEDMIKVPHDSMLAELVGYKSNLKKLRRVMTYHVHVFTVLKDERLPGIPEGIRHEIIDVFEQLDRVLTLTVLHHDVATDLRDGYISMASHRLNNIMKILTIITAIFVPLGFLAGIYGMNFEFMPELAWRYSYFLLLGTMATIAGSLIFLFRRQGWM